MKKTLLLSALTFGIISALSSCKEIDPIEEKAEYTNCVVVSTDTLTGVSVATDYATINVSADMSSMLFQLTFSDLKLQPDANLETVKISGLTQYLKDVTDPASGEVDYLYTFFSTSAAYTDGISIRNLRFGWLSTVYWCTFTSGANRVWMVPKDFQIYANKNKITNMREDEFAENAIHPRYDISINTDKETVTLTGRGVTFPTTNQASGNIEFRNQYKIADVKFRKDFTGLVATAEELWPVTDGATGKWKITDFYFRFDADYDGEHEARYTLTNTTTNESIRIISTFGYNNERNY